jgi:predicted transposase YbfD/YdcC
MPLLDPASPLGRLSHHLCAVTDPRWQRRPSHLLHEILLMGLCTFFTGGRTFVDMAHFALSHQSWLSSFLTLPGGPPCHDTFNRVFSALDPRQLEDALRHWSAGLEIAPLPADHGPLQLRHLAIDGKVLRGSRRGPGPAPSERARAVVNVWLAGQGLVLAQRRIPEECSEIVQAPLLLRHLRLKNTVVTADAAHAQSATASQITAQGGDYLLTVKANQPGTQQAIRDFLEPLLAATPEGHSQTVDKARGSIETRRCWLRTDLEDFAPRGQWSGLGAVALLETRCENITTGKITIEQRCCITSLGVPSDTTPAATAGLAATVAQLARAHWGIENSLHWRLDVLMGEDASRARTGEAPANLAILRKITLNTLKVHAPFPGKKGETMSIRSRQYVASINPNYLASLIKNPALTP